jgi:hypothetical protein
MELTERLNHLEDELKLLKAELRTVLIGIREELLRREGPFEAGGTVPPVRVTRLEQPAGGGPPALAVPPPAASAAPAAVVTGSAELHAPAPPRPLPARTPWLGPPLAHDMPSTHQASAPVQVPAISVALPVDPHEPCERGVLDIASLGRWADATCRRVGRRRLDEILDVYELLNGSMPEGTRSAVVRMADLCGPRDDPERVGINDVMVVLSQLDGLLRGHGGSEVTLLSLLSEAA